MVSCPCPPCTYFDRFAALSCQYIARLATLLCALLNWHATLLCAILHYHATLLCAFLCSHALLICALLHCCPVQNTLMQWLNLSMSGQDTRLCHCAGLILEESVLQLCHATNRDLAHYVDRCWRKYSSSGALRKLRTFEIYINKYNIMILNARATFIWYQ